MKKIQCWKLLTRLLVGAALFLGGSHGAAAAGRGEKVALCHVPPGNPANAHTVTVGAAAVDGHLEHGDTLGDCPILCRNDGLACDDGSQ